MYLELKTAPAELLVSADDIKTHLRISHTADDAYIATLAAAVSTDLDGPDGYLRRALVTQAWYAKFEEWPCAEEIHLPLPPLGNVVAVTYYDSDNALQTFSADSYHVVKPYGGRAEIELKFGQSFPTLYPRPDAVSVEFTAGYGAAADVPAPIRQAALLLAGDLYANRGDDPAEMLAGAGMTTQNAAAARALLSRYVWREIA